MSAVPAPAMDVAQRIERAFQGLAFIASGLLVGVLGVLAVAVVVLGAMLSVVWIGLPLLIMAVGACWRLAELDRRQANRLLDARLGPLRGQTRASDTPWRRGLQALSDRRLWRVAVLLMIRLPLSIAALAVALVPIVITAQLLVLGAQGITGVGDVEYVGPLRQGLLTGLLLCVLAPFGAVLAIAVLDGLRTVLRALTRALVAPPPGPGGPVREMLAESLGDRSLNIAYWLPDRETFVDDAGHPVALPGPESGRAWTAVDRDGRRVAAIIHDAALDTGPELVQAAAAAAELAIDNERLKADLRARVEDLRISRARIVEAADAARRRLERDLHDGAQQQLVSLALDLRLLRSKLGESDATPLVDALSEKLSVALAELRELARGIHPAILTDRGLGPAVDALGDRVPLPVQCDVSLEERLSAPIEAAAYFVVAEALTNIAKYSEAAWAKVDIHRDGDDVVVVVQDDGVGGASIDTGSGLRGLHDRLSALDGTLVIDSPGGSGTRLQARIPCYAAALVTEAQESDRIPGPTGSPPGRELEPRR